ncbi:MAG: FAD-binding oxidoreductase [Solirubrobacterales bacterium]
MPDSDIVVELLHYDPENYRLDMPIRDGVATITSLERLTRDIVDLKIEVTEPADFSFVPGQYIDLWVPESDERRSFSMANTPGDEVELMIKCYAGGRFSALLGGELKAGDELRFTGPYGSFRLRDSENDVLLVAGGSGMAPVLALLRQLAGERSSRTIRFFYGARTADDLFHLREINELGESLPDFEFSPVLSDAEDELDWVGQRGLVHDAVGEYLKTGDSGAFETYACGPPAMIDALTELLIEQHAVDEGRIFFDKFTTAVSDNDLGGIPST